MSNSPRVPRNLSVRTKDQQNVEANDDGNASRRGIDNTQVRL